MSSSSTVALSVIVPVYNHWHLVPALMDCLSKQTLGTDRFELLLVDNGSDDVPSDGTFPDWVRLLHCESPGSYAARNVGLNAAQGAYVAFTDADCRPRPSWLTCLIKEAVAYERTLVAGNVAMEPADWGSMTPTEVFDVIMGLPQERYVRHGHAATANLLVPMSAFDEIGPFDSTRFSGGDSEFCTRAVSHGWKLRYCPDAEVAHPARRSWDEIRTKHRRVKGGQLTTGPLRRRCLYAVATLLPPFRQMAFALNSDRLGLGQRLQACGMLILLWGVGLAEIARLLTGGTPERR